LRRQLIANIAQLKLNTKAWINIARKSVSCSGITGASSKEQSKLKNELATLT
jgi:hypothetical protein